MGFHWLLPKWLETKILGATNGSHRWSRRTADSLGSNELIDVSLNKFRRCFILFNCRSLRHSVHNMVHTSHLQCSVILGFGHKTHHRTAKLASIAQKRILEFAKHYSNSMHSMSDIAKLEARLKCNSHHQSATNTLGATNQYVPIPNNPQTSVI